MSSIALAMCLCPGAVYATLTDGTYTGTTSGQYFTGACTGPGVNSGGNIPFSSATVTLEVQNNGANVTLTISKAGAFTVTGLGFQTGGSLDLDFNAANGSPRNVNISAQMTGDSTSGMSAFVPAVQSGNDISVDFQMLSGTTANCSSVIFDWNPFTVMLSGGQMVDPAITPSTTLTIPNILNTQVSTIAYDIGSRVGEALRGNSGFARTTSGLMYGLDSGLNAGDATIPFGAWVSYAYNDFDNDFAAIKFDGVRHSVLAGADFTPWENTVLGVAFGYENNDIDTDFNSGEQDTDGFTIAPYFGWLLNDILSVDLAAGYSRMDTDQFRIAPGTTTKINSSPNADRWFVTMNFSGVWVIDNWILGASTGGLYAKHAEESFVESDGTAVSSLETELGQWRISGDAAYSFGAWEPFARVTYENDFEQTKIGVIGGPQPSFDDDNVLVGGGIRYFGTKGISGNLEFYKRLGREDFDEHAITLTIRGEF